MSATSVGEIGLDLVVNQNQFNKQMSGITSLAKKAGAALAGAFAVKKVVDFGKKCLELGSDLQEVQNVVDVTFPHMTAQVDKFAKSAAQSFGLSETMAKRYTGTFGAMAKAFGFTESAAYEMSATLTGLAGDVASFYNLSQDEAYTKLKSVFTGETETLKDLGVVMTQAALDQYALANGYGKTTAAMTEQEKVALRYAFVQQQLSAAQGDFARTSDSWANQTRVMALQLQSIMATIGQGLINLFTPVIKIVNVVLGKIATLANAFKAFTELITGKKSSGSSTVAAPVSELASAADTASSGLSGTSGAADSLADSTKGVGSAAKKAAKEMRALMGFDQIQKLDSQTDTSGGGSSGGGGGSGGAGGGALGSAVDFGSLAEGETVLDEVDSTFTKMFETLLKFLEPTTNAFKKLWKEGLARLGNFAWGSLKDFYNGFLVPVAKWTFGKGLPEFINALNNGLMKVDFAKIQASLRGLWDALAPFAINVGEGLLWFWQNVLVPLGTWVANEIVPRFLDTLSISIGGLNNIITALQPLFQWFWESVLVPISQWTGGIFLQIWDGINGALQALSEWCAANPSIVQTMAKVIASFFAAFKIVSIVSGIAEMISKLGGLIGIITKIGGLISSVLNPWTIAIGAVITAGVLLYQNWDVVKAKAIEIWGHIQTFLSETWDTIKETAIEIWENISSTLIEAWGAVKEKAASIFSAIRTTLSNVWNGIKTTATQMWQSIRTGITNIWNGIKNTASSVFGTLKTTISGVWTRIKTITSSIWNGIKSTVTGVWNNLVTAATKTGTNIKNGFSKAFKGLVNIIKTPINGVIALLNGLIGAVNSLLSAIESRLKFDFTIPNPFGGTIVDYHWQAKLPRINYEIPALAQGGFVKPNTPQLAMIGDNRHQGEVVAPEDKLQAMVDEAVLRASGRGGITKEELESIINRAVARIIAALASVGFNLDGEQLATLQRMAQTTIDRRYNTTEIL